MRPLYISNPLFSSHSPSAIFPSWVVPLAYFLRITWISLSAGLSVRISLRSSLSIWRLMVSVILAWSAPRLLSSTGASSVSCTQHVAPDVAGELSFCGVSNVSSGCRIQPWFCRCFISPSQGESPDSLERMSGLPASFPGRYLIVKSELANRSPHQACLKLRSFFVFQYSRFLCSVRIVIFGPVVLQ